MIKTSLFFLICFSSIPLYAQHKYTLEECFETAFKNNPATREWELRIRQAENTLDESKRKAFPSVSGSFSQGFNSGRSIDPFTNSFVQRSISSNALGIGANWNVFNGFALRNQIRQNREDVQAEYYQLQQSKRELKAKVIIAYMQVLMNQQLYSVASQQEQALMKQLSLIKEIVKEGLRASMDSIDFEAQLATASFDALTAKNDITIAKLNLRQLLGQRMPLTFDIENIVLENNIYDEGFPDRILSDLDRQPSLKTADLRAKSAETSIKIAAATRFPSVSLSGGLGSAYSSAAVSEFNYFNQLNYNFNQYLRLGINFPLYNNGQVKNRVKAAEINLKILHSQIEAQKHQLTSEIEQAFLACKMAYDKLAAANLNLKAQQVAFKSANERFNEGFLSSVELNAFRTNLEKAKSALIQTQYEYYSRKVLMELYNE